jgi:hypothetical protein
MEKQYFCRSADGFHHFWLSFCEEYQELSFCLLQNPSSKPLKEACSGFPIAACDSSVFPKAACAVYL